MFCWKINQCAKGFCKKNLAVFPSNLFTHRLLMHIKFKVETFFLNLNTVLFLLIRPALSKLVNYQTFCFRQNLHAFQLSEVFGFCLPFEC